jgi:hypothetical protein
MSLITVIGRGHSGTRAMSHTLTASGVFMGEPLNRSGDLLPPQPMYDACRLFAHYVRWNGDLSWDWQEAKVAEIPAVFTHLIETYLTSVRESTAEHKGWKIPETTLVFPWIARLFPEAKYILWVRDPRDCILGRHLTDDLTEWGIAYPDVGGTPQTGVAPRTGEAPQTEGVTGVGEAPQAGEASQAEGESPQEPVTTEPEPDPETVRLRRAISWKYQYDLVNAMPKPAHWIEVRFEDFVLRQDETLARLEDFLGLPLARIPVNVEAVGRWRHDPSLTTYDFLAPAMAQYGYGGE